MSVPRRVRTALPAIGLLVALGAGPADAQSTSNPCKVLTPAEIEETLDAPVKKSKVKGTDVAGAKSCAYDVGPGLGEPGGGMVVVTTYSGPIAAGIGNDIKSRAEKLSGRVVWDPLVRVAYVVKPKLVVGISISSTDGDPSTEELKPAMAELVTAATKSKK